MLQHCDALDDYLLGLHQVPDLTWSQINIPSRASCKNTSAHIFIHIDEYISVHIYKCT